MATNDAGVVERSVTLTLQSKTTTHTSDWHQVLHNSGNRSSHNPSTFLLLFFPLSFLPPSPLLCFSFLFSFLFSCCSFLYCFSISSFHSSPCFLCPSLSGAPTITLEPVETVVDAGSTVVLNCQASGEPTPVIQWSRLSRPLLANQRFTQLTNGSLRLASAQKEDTAEYECVARNLMGSVLVRVPLTVRGECVCAYISLTGTRRKACPHYQQCPYQ